MPRNVSDFAKQFNSFFTLHTFGEHSKGEKSQEKYFLRFDFPFYEGKQDMCGL